MKHLITRRDFLKASGFALAAGGLTDRLIAADLSSSPDLVAVEGLNYYDSTTQAVEALGGIRRFVSNGARVGLLVNSVFDKPGTFVKPQIALALVAMCYEAGAKEIVSLEDVSAGILEARDAVEGTCRDGADHSRAQGGAWRWTSRGDAG